MGTKDSRKTDSTPAGVQKSDVAQAPAQFGNAHNVAPIHAPLTVPATLPTNGAAIPALVHSPDEAEAEPFDLSDVIVKRRNWNDPGMVMTFDSYTAVGTALAVEPYKSLCSNVGSGTTMAVYMDIHLLKDGSGDIAGVPAAKMGKNTLEVSWSKGGGTFRIDLAPFLAKRPFPMPDETRAHLPVEFKTLKGVGQCMVIHFSGAEFSRIETGSRPRKKKNPEQPAQPTPEKPTEGSV